MLTTEDFKNIHVCIATPCYGGQVFQNYLLSVITLLGDANKRGLNISFIVRGGDSLIPRTRNSIVAEFLASKEFTHLLWIDADIGFSPMSIYRLLMIDIDVVAGVYPLKKIVWPEEGLPQGMTEDEFRAHQTRYPFNPVAGGDSTITEYGFMEVHDAPTGLMCIKREALERMARNYPGLRYVPDAMLGVAEKDRETADYHYRFFDVMTEESGRYLSEDYAFCRRWQNIGGKVFVDVESKLSHHGSHIFEGDLKSSLLAMSDKLRAVDSSTPSAQ
jgi:hypothetical protein